MLYPYKRKIILHRVKQTYTSSFLPIYTADDMTRMFPNEIPFFQPDKRRKEDAFSRMLRQNVQVQLIRQSVEQQTFYQIQCIGSNFCKVGYVCIVLFLR
ncbi:hypothetical protein B5G41_05695 [Alistipes onderdonkii]|uniref:Uncharacterized protein n=1 Tax=Alistipes onderdonkii TaxID=328813 RepID=A0A1Y3QWA1_9BACT|nr:hypothetical protein B5G41_05695 [Alistipes onderdonkii]